MSKRKKVKCRKTLPSYLVVTRVKPSDRDYKRIKKADLKKIIDDVD